MRPSAEIVRLPRTTMGRWLLLDSLSWGPLAQTYGALVSLIDWDILAIDCQLADPRFFGAVND
jgi:hypothetical protein